MTQMKGPIRVELRKWTVMRLLALLSVGLFAFVASACSTDSDSGDGSGGSFSYTDARGETVDLDTAPTKIVMSEQAAAALMPYGIRPVGVWGSGEPKDSPVLAGLDMSGVETLGIAYGKIDVDKLASLEPDLVVTGWYPGGYLGGLGKPDAEVSQKIAKAAPMIAVSAEKSASESLSDWRDLAAQLGADVDSGSADSDKKAYDEAVAAFKEATAARPGVTAYAIAPSNLFYVAIPDEFAELRDYREWGLDVLRSTVAKDDTSGSFSPVSWENAGDYQSDLLLYDTRTERSAPLEQVQAEHPTVNALRTVTDGNVADWTTDATFSYATYTTQINAVTAALEKLPATD
jgi:iron complex transport system substrate-binding protein